MQHLDLAPEITFPRCCSGLASQTAAVTSFFLHRRLPSSLHASPTQTDSSKHICGRPVLSAPLELNKHLIINGHRALDRRPAFVARECARTDSAGWGGGSHQRFLLCFVWMTPLLLFLTTLKVLFAGERCLLCLNTSRRDRDSVDY